MIEDMAYETIRIDIKVVNGEIKQLKGECLPRLKDNSIGYLSIGASHIEDEAFRKKYRSTEVVKVLEAGESVYLAMTTKLIPEDLLKEVADTPSGEGRNSSYMPPYKYKYVAVYLEQPLMMALQAGRTACLKPCKCSISASASKLEAISLNQAYTLASEKFEPGRASHTGNVFTKCKFYCTDSKQWISLAKYRDRKEEEHFKKQELQSNESPSTRT